MITRRTNTCLFTPNDIVPSHPDLKVIGVFNPGVVRYDDEIILLVRVAEAAKEEREGLKSSPKLTGLDKGTPHYEIDWFEVDETYNDPRKYRLNNGYFRLSSISHLEIVRLNSDGKTVKSIEKLPDLFGQGPEENYGIEDPRITKIDDTFFITCVVVSEKMGVATALMSTKDFRSFTRHGVIFPWENKDVVLFPQKINNHYWAYIRPVGDLAIKSFSIMSAQSHNLHEWGEFAALLDGHSEGCWDSTRLGVAAPPIKTKEGWLFFYHEVIKLSDEEIGRYVIHAGLADLHNPNKILAHTSDPILVPELNFETHGFVPNVIFPTGVIEDKNNPDILQLFYGAADSMVAEVSISTQEVLASL